MVWVRRTSEAWANGGTGGTSASQELADTGGPLPRGCPVGGRPARQAAPGRWEPRLRLTTPALTQSGVEGHPSPRLLPCQAEREASSGDAVPPAETVKSAALQWLDKAVDQMDTEALRGSGTAGEPQTDATASTRGSEACCESNSESPGPEDTAPGTGDAKEPSPAEAEAWSASTCLSTVERAAVAEEEGASAGTALLSMLRPPGACARAGAVHHEPQPLSTDEYALWSMQEREDREAGADSANAETFGDDAVLRGWSFEENLAANERIAKATAIHAPEPQAQQQFYERWWLPDRQCAPAEPLETAIAEVERLKRAMHEAVELTEVKPDCMKKVMHLVVSNGWNHITWRCDYTALHLAAELGRPDVVPLLVVMRGDLEAKDSKGRTPMDVAKARGRDVAAFSPLQPACLAARQLDELVGDARDGGLLPKEQSNDALRETILDMRCLNLALVEVIKLLPLEPECLKAAVLYTAASGGGVLSWQAQHTTCLHLAAELCRDDLMPLLITLRADPDMPDCSGMTALDVVTARQHWPSVLAMQQAKRNEGPKPWGITTRQDTSDRGEPDRTRRTDADTVILQ